MDEKHMGKQKHLKLRGQTYFFRIRVPKELVPVYRTTEITRTLGTRDRKEAEKLCALMLAEWIGKFDEQRAQLRASLALPKILLDQLSTFSMQALVTQWLERRKEEERYTRSRQPEQGSEDYVPPDHTIKELKEALAEVEHGPETLRNDWADNTALDVARCSGIETVFTIEKPLLVKRERVKTDVSKKPFKEFRELCRKAICELLRFQVSIYADNPLPHKAVYTEFDTAVVSQVSNQPRTLDALITRFWADPNNVLSKTLTYKYEFLFALLRECWGPEMPLQQLSRDHCCEVRDLIIKLPPNCKKRFNGFSFKEIAEIDPDHKGPVMKTATANDHISRIGTLLSFAVTADWIEKNHAMDLRVKRKRKAEEKRRKPFSQNQLVTIFSQKEFDRSANVTTFKPERYWVPIIALYHGMRLHEICQLLLKDLDKEDEVSYFHVREEGEGQRVKTEQSIRQVPWHPMLLKLGFDRYIKMLRDKGHQDLFPSLKKEGHDYRSRNVGRWFNERLLVGAGLKEPTLVFHSFRHTFKDATRNCGVPYEIAEAISGRELGGVGSQYGKGYGVKVLAKHLKKVKYSGTDELLMKRNAVQPVA